MSLTILCTILNWTGAPSLTAEVLAPNGTTVLNGAGDGSPVSVGLKYLTSFSFSDVIPPGLYTVRYANSGAVFASGSVWIESPTGTFTVDDPIRMEVYKQQFIKAGVIAALSEDSPEPGAGAPAANASVLAKIGYLFKAWRNKKTQTADQYSLYNSDGVTVDQHSAITDDNTTTTIGGVTGGP